MNNVTLIGRLTKDVELRYTQAQEPMAIAKFTIAVDRKNKKDEQSADFINCIAFKKTAEFIEKYFTKGMKIAIQGHIQTGSYEGKDGKKVYTTEVAVDNCEFVEKKEAAPSNSGGWEKIPQGIEEELPFS
jgi:single-strand DNA-binding protein